MVTSKISDICTLFQPFKSQIFCILTISIINDDNNNNNNKSNSNENSDNENSKGSNSNNHGNSNMILTKVLVRRNQINFLVYC